MKFVYQRAEIEGVFKHMREVMAALPAINDLMMAMYVAKIRVELEQASWAMFCDSMKGDIRGCAVSVSWNDFEAIIHVNPEAITDMLSIVPVDVQAKLIAGFINFVSMFKSIDTEQIHVNNAAYNAKWGLLPSQRGGDHEDPTEH